MFDFYTGCSGSTEHLMSHMLKTTSLKGEQMASIKFYHGHLKCWHPPKKMKVTLGSNKSKSQRSTGIIHPWLFFFFSLNFIRQRLFKRGKGVKTYTGTLCAE
jgi:hypothetical protein